MYNSGNCYYEQLSHTSKATLKAKIEELQAFKERSDHVFESLASGENVERILKGFQDGGSLEDILNGLKKEDLSTNVPAWHLNYTSPSQSSSRTEHSYIIPDAIPADLSETTISQIQADHVVVTGDHNGSIEAWTRVTTDRDLVEHLMSLYFCWEYSIFASLSRLHFLSDFQSGYRRFCSPLLVNAVLAVGYYFSANAKRDCDGLPQDNAYLEEAEHLLKVEQNRPALTTIQALCVMSILQMSQGGTDQGDFYCGQAIRMCVEMGLHLNIDSTHVLTAEREVQRVTAWGAFALDQ